MWDIENPRKPTLTTAYVCPASQSDVSVYGNLLFISGEDLSARLDCGTQGVQDTVSTRAAPRAPHLRHQRHPPSSKRRQRADLPRLAHALAVVDPKDSANVYVYISGSSAVRSPSELAGLRGRDAVEDPNTAWFRIEVIKVPVAHPEQAAIVSSPRIFDNLVAPQSHGETPADSAADAKEIADAKAAGKFIITVDGEEQVLGDEDADSILKSDRAVSPGAAARRLRRTARCCGRRSPDRRVHGRHRPRQHQRSRPSVTTSRSIPAIGLGGGACEGYGLLLDIADPAGPVRIGEVADSNFSYWHSATFNNDGTKLLFSDEWGGGSQPKCRSTDKREWGADAIFTIEDRRMHFQSYYKLPLRRPRGELRGAQRLADPDPGPRRHGAGVVPGRALGLRLDRRRQAGGDRVLRPRAGGPHPDGERRLLVHLLVQRRHLRLGDGARARRLRARRRARSSPRTRSTRRSRSTSTTATCRVSAKFVWPPTFALARAYLDQLERSKGLAGDQISATRDALGKAEKASDGERQASLSQTATQLESGATGADAAKVRMLAEVVKALGAAAQGATSAGTH